MKTELIGTSAYSDFISLGWDDDTQRFVLFLKPCPVFSKCQPDWVDA